MSRARKFAAAHGLCALALVLTVSSSSAVAKEHHKAKKPLPPLPSGPTGPVPQVPLDSIRPVAPQVSFKDGQLTIVAPNSSLGDILRSVRKQTGAEIDIPTDAQERVVTNLGPGPAREVVADLLNGSRFNYVLVGSPQDSTALTRVVLVAKSGADAAGKPGQPGNAQAANLAPPPQENQPEAAEAEATDDSNAAPDENSDQQPAAEAEQEQPAQPADQPGVKTPQQMLQEMQQRQMQLQQMQPPGQPPIPGSGMPPHPPEEQPQ